MLLFKWLVQLEYFCTSEHKMPPVALAFRRGSVPDLNMIRQQNGLVHQDGHPLGLQDGTESLAIMRIAPSCVSWPSGRYFNSHLVSVRLLCTWNSATDESATC
jgi:hypothetical protein